MYVSEFVIFEISNKCDRIIQLCRPPTSSPFATNNFSASRVFVACCSWQVCKPLAIEPSRVWFVGLTLFTKRVGCHFVTFRCARQAEQRHLHNFDCSLDTKFGWHGIFVPSKKKEAFAVVFVGYNNMVRLKNRWLVLRVDQMEDTTGGVCEKKNRPVSSLPWLSKRDLFLLINDLFTESFGITYSGALRETKGKKEFQSLSVLQPEKILFLTVLLLQFIVPNRSNGWLFFIDSFFYCIYTYVSPFIVACSSIVRPAIPVGAHQDPSTHSG